MTYNCTLCGLTAQSQASVRSVEDCDHVLQQSRIVFQGLNKQRLEQDDVCDVTIHVKDASLKAHMCVLTCSSRYFQALFAQRVISETAAREVTLDLEMNAVQIILDFIYTGRMSFSFSDVETVLQAADYLLVEDLRTYMQLYLEAVLSVETCLKIMLLSQTYSFYNLYQSACDVFRSRIRDCIQPKELFNVLEISDILLLLDDHNISSVLDNKTTRVMLTRWLRHNKEGISVAVQDELEVTLEKRGLHLADILSRVDQDVSAPRFSNYFMRPRKRKLPIPNNEPQPSTSYDSLLSTPGIGDGDIDLIIANGHGSNLAFILQQDRWVRLPPLPDIRKFHKMVQLNHEVYLLGGSQTSYIPSESCLDLTELTWRALPPTTHVFLQVEDAVVSGVDQVCLLGQTAIGERYDPVAKTWFPLAHYKVGSELSELRAAGDGQRLYICFTEEELFTSNTIVRFSEYNFEENQWRTLPHPPVPPQRKRMVPNNNPVHLDMLQNYNMFCKNSQVYLCNVHLAQNKREIYEYDTEEVQWSKISPASQSCLYSTIQPYLPSTSTSPSERQVQTLCWDKGSCVLECNSKKPDWSCMTISESCVTSGDPLEWHQCAAPPFTFIQDNLVLCHAKLSARLAENLLSLPTATYICNVKTSHF